MGKLSHVNRGASSMKPLDAAGPSAGLDTMAEDLDQLKYDVGELKDLLSNNKGEINHGRRIVLACERDMEDFTAAMDAVNVDLDEMRARVDATHSIITSRQRVEATMTAEISTMRLDIGDIQEALKNHDSWMEDVSNTLQQMQEKEENLTEDIINLKNEMNTKLDTKVDNCAWKEANDDVDARRRKVDEILATIRHDITAVETNLEESKAKPVIWQNTLQQYAVPSKGSALYVCSCALAHYPISGVWADREHTPGQQSLRAAGRTRRPTKMSAREAWPTLAGVRIRDRNLMYGKRMRRK